LAVGKERGNAVFFSFKEITKAEEVGRLIYWGQKVKVEIRCTD